MASDSCANHPYSFSFLIEVLGETPLLAAGPHGRRTDDVYSAQKRRQLWRQTVHQTPKEPNTPQLRSIPCIVFKDPFIN